MLKHYAKRALVAYFICSKIRTRKLMRNPERRLRHSHAEHGNAMYKGRRQSAPTLAIPILN